MRRREHQSGFGTTLILLVVLVVAVLAVTGVIVYQHHKSSSTKYSAATSPSQTSTQPKNTTTTKPAQTVANQNVVNIPELGIQITVPDSIKDLTYQVSTVPLPNGVQATLAMFTTVSLTAADSGCGSSAGPLGSLERASGQYPANSNTPLAYGQLVKQFPTFYITVDYPNAPCSTSASAGSDAAATRNNGTAVAGKQAFANSVSTIQPLSSSSN